MLALHVRSARARAARARGKWTALMLALFVNLLFIGVLVFSVSWQNRKPEAVSAELYAPPPVNTPRPQPKVEPPHAPKTEPPPEPKPVPQASRSGRRKAGHDEADIALKAKREAERKQQERRSASAPSGARAAGGRGEAGGGKASGRRAGAPATAAAREGAGERDRRERETRAARPGGTRIAAARAGGARIAAARAGRARIAIARASRPGSARTRRAGRRGCSPQQIAARLDRQDPQPDPRHTSTCRRTSPAIPRRSSTSCSCRPARSST